MSITARSLDAAVREFKDQVDGLLNGTLTLARIQPNRLDGKKGRSTLVAIGLRSSRGVPGASLLSRTYRTRLVLSVGQHLMSEVTNSGDHVLRTVKYRYGLTLEGENDALIRWEYDRQRLDQRCRHHIQGAPEVIIKNQHVPLKDFHLPSGYVPLEEVIRFCIVDLGVKPLSENWDDILTESYQRFRRNLLCPLFDSCEQAAELRDL